MQEETVTQRVIRLAKEGKMDEARELFTKAIDEMPFDAALRCNYARTYLHEEKYAEALLHYEKAIKLDPAFNGSYLSAGMCLSGLGLQEDALQLYDLALRVIPDDYDIWYNKAHTLMEMGRIPEAIAGFDQVLRVHPHDARSFINRRDLLKLSTFKGQCTLYSFEEGKMIPQIGYIYAYEETCFVTLAIDEVNEQDLDEYDLDLVEYYDRNDDGEFGVTKKSDPRYRTRSLVYFTPEGVMAHGQLEHSPEFPAYSGNYVVDGYEILCPENIWCEVIYGVGVVIYCVRVLISCMLMIHIRLKCLMYLRRGGGFRSRDMRMDWMKGTGRIVRECGGLLRKDIDWSLKFG